MLIISSLSSEVVLIYLTFSLLMILLFSVMVQLAIKAVFQVITAYFNQYKSYMLCQSNASIPRISIMDSASGISKHYFPFIYLNIPIVNAKCMTSYCSDLIPEEIVKLQ